MSQLIDKLKERYPDGLILGDALVIVGILGLTINWFNPDGTKGEVRFAAGETLSVVKIVGNMIEVHKSGQLPHNGALLSPLHFKGIIFNHSANH